MKANLVALQTEYDVVAPIAHRFIAELTKQLTELLTQNKIHLAAALESRVKTWSSLSEKLSRRTFKMSGIKDFNDLIGLRLILLFRRDLEHVESLLKETFQIISYEDTARRLTEDRFGYASVHYVIQLPDAWLALPTLRPMQGLKAEIQVRTIAQHIWAAASHVLQYKQETGVPIPLRRTIHRVSALLETVDLEFERVLAEKEVYQVSVPALEAIQPLDVISLEKILDSVFPPDNKDEVELYDELLHEILGLGIKTTDQLKGILVRHRKNALEADKERVATEKGNNYQFCEPDEIERVERGVYFTQTGLTRHALGCEFEQSE